MIERTIEWGEYIVLVTKQTLRWLLVVALLALAGYMAYLNIQLKADKRVSEAEAKTQVLAGEVEILQATIIKLQKEGENLSQTPR